jgi:hypothetical protein
LPADPGTAGEATLAGIDTDVDGLRDDLQRFIALSHPRVSDRETRGALRELAQALQDAIAGTTGASESIALAILRAMECIDRRRPADGLDLASQLVVEAANTRDRANAYLAFGDQVGGFSATLVDPESSEQPCLPEN